MHPLLDLAAFLAVLCAILYGTIWVHELGHVLVDRLVGFRPLLSGAGLGRVIVSGRIAGTTFYAARSHVTQGLTFTQMGLNPSRWRQAASFAGGATANAAVALGAWFCFPSPDAHAPNGWWHIAGIACVLNGIYAVANMVPFSASVGTGRLLTDGARIILTLADKPLPTTFSNEINLGRILGDLAHQTNVDVLRRMLLYLCAINWATVRNHERAGALISEADALDSPLDDLGQFLSFMARGALANSESRWDDCDNALRAARDIAEESGNGRAIAAADIVRAGSLIERGDLAGAEAALSRLAENRYATSDPNLRNGIRVLQYLVAAKTHQPVPDGIEADFDKLLRRKRTDPLTCIHILRARAERRRVVGDPAGAIDLYLQQLREVDRLADELIHPDDKAGLHPLRGLIRHKIADAVAVQGRDPDAEPIPDATPVDAPERPAEESWQTIVGATLLLANIILSFVGILVLALLIPPVAVVWQFRESLVIWLFLVGLFSRFFLARWIFSEVLLLLGPRQEQPPNGKLLWRPLEVWLFATVAAIINALLFAGGNPNGPAGVNFPANIPAKIQPADEWDNPPAELPGKD